MECHKNLTLYKQKKISILHNKCFCNENYYIREFHFNSVFVLYEVFEQKKKKTSVVESFNNKKRRHTRIIKNYFHFSFEFMFILSLYICHELLSYITKGGGFFSLVAIKFTTVQKNTFTHTHMRTYMYKGTHKKKSTLETETFKTKRNKTFSICMCLYICHLFLYIYIP